MFYGQMFKDKDKVREIKRLLLEKYEIIIPTKINSNYCLLSENRFFFSAHFTCELQFKISDT